MLRRVFGERKQGFYIDVGAMDPVLESVTKWFYDDGWHGINIEPNKFFFEKLVNERSRDVNLNVAIGEHGGEKPLYVFEQYGTSTFDPANRDRFVELGYSCEEKLVPVATLAAICAEHASESIDFLKVDCEGWENFVLRGADWERFRPTVLIVEATEPMSTVPSWHEWEPFLTETARYEFVYFDGLNRFYVPRERSELRSHFDRPPNVLDNFQIWPTIRAENRIAQLEHELRVKQHEIEDLANQHKAELENAARLTQELTKMRLWVGRLSQELAAKKKTVPRA